MRISLSIKMLLLTLGSFLLLIFGILASLYLYFNRFYEPEKINQMIQSMNKFTSELESNQWTEDQLYSEVAKFMKNQNVGMSIQSPYSQFTTTAVQAMRIRKFPDNALINNIFSKNTLMMKNLQEMFPEFDTEGVFPITYAKGAASDISDYYSLASTPMSIDIVASANINGTLVLYPSTSSTTITISDTIDTYYEKGISYTISTIPYTNYRQVDFTKESTLKNGEIKIISVNLSLQSVDEVTKFLMRFFPFLITASIILTFIMVMVYTKTISKPIIRITDTANRMANMELGISSNIKRKDELGALSTSLNTLSINLKNALDDLNYANDKLKTDYENEIRQEKARKEFVANVSHELKTPLGIIRSYTEGIRDGVKSEKRAHYMEVVLNEITHMDQMLLEMLEISKFDAGIVTYNKVTSPIKPFLNKAIHVFCDKALNKGVTFELIGEFDTVKMDEKKIERVLNNLIGNAVKYCNNNSIIRIFGEHSCNIQWIRIENECPKLSEETLSKIWDRFYKVDSSHNRDIEGTGLGLAIVKSILEGHGCTYGVINTDRGINFYFTLDT